MNNKLGYIEKYKALIAGIESNESKNKRNAVDMEVTWNLDLENKANEVVKDKTKEKNAKTPFQQYLEKRKEKKRRKKLENQSDLEMVKLQFFFNIFFYSVIQYGTSIILIIKFLALEYLISTL